MIAKLAREVEVDESKEKKIVTELGRLVVSFANHEECLREAIAWLVPVADGPSVPDVTGVLLTKASHRDLVEIFGALCREYGPPRVDLDDAKLLCGYLNRLAAERNTYIHSAWKFVGTLVHGHSGPLPMHAERTKRQANVRKGFDIKMDVVDEAEISDLSRRLSAANDLVFQVIEQFIPEDEREYQDYGPPEWWELDREEDEDQGDNEEVATI